MKQVLRFNKVIKLIIIAGDLCILNTIFIVLYHIIDVQTLGETFANSLPRLLVLLNLVYITCNYSKGIILHERSMRPERIVPDCFAFYLLSRYGMNYHEGTCLIDLMMHSGKINYVVQNLLGYSDIGEAMGYSKEENDWCKENEKEIWNYICTNDHLHARDPMVIRYYMKPAPAVDMLGAQAPALIGTWMGARIIASYMKKHKDMKLKDLLEFTDYHVMLSESNYLAS